MSDHPKKQKQEILDFLAALHDDEKELEMCIDFLNKLIRSGGKTPPPMVELLTVLKYEKTKLYYLLKKRLHVKANFALLFELDANYEEARKSLYRDQLLSKPEQPGTSDENN